MDDLGAPDVQYGRWMCGGLARGHSQAEASIRTDGFGNSLDHPLFFEGDPDSFADCRTTLREFTDRTGGTLEKQPIQSLFESKQQVG